MLKTHGLQLSLSCSVLGPCRAKSQCFQHTTGPGKKSAAFPSLQAEHKGQAKPGVSADSLCKQVIFELVFHEARPCYHKTAHDAPVHMPFYSSIHLQTLLILNSLL